MKKNIKIFSIILIAIICVIASSLSYHSYLDMCLKNESAVPDTEFYREIQKEVREKTFWGKIEKSLSIGIYGEEYLWNDTSKDLENQKVLKESICNHVWQDATCVKAKTCTLCGETSGYSLSHAYSEKGICSLCGETKEWSNSYGYFSDSDLYTMAKHAVETCSATTYVITNYCYISDIHIEKVADPKLQYGNDSFTIVASADFLSISRGTTKTRNFIAVVEPHTQTKYTFKDIYIE